MATRTPSSPPRRGKLVLAAVAAAVIVAIVLVVVAVVAGGDDEDGEDRAAAVTQAAGGAATGDAAEGGATGAEATTVESVLPYVEEVQAMLEGVPQEGTILGNPDAPVTVTEFADLRCPACRSWETQQFPTLLEEGVKTGRVKVDLQIVSILGPDSDRAATGGWAAVRQDRVWPFAMLWYFNQGPESEEYATDEFQRAIAAGAGLDVEQFDADRAETGEDAEAALRRAEEAGFQGTPAFVVSGPGGTIPFVEGGVPTAEDLLDAAEQLQG